MHGWQTLPLPWCWRRRRRWLRRTKMTWDTEKDKKPQPPSGQRRRRIMDRFWAGIAEAALVGVALAFMMAFILIPLVYTVLSMMGVD